MVFAPRSRMPVRSPLAALKSATPAILPSLLLCDFGNLEREIAALEAAGVPGFHLDVMDGSFVPNLTYGMPIVEAVRRLTKLPVDVHLMISDPLTYAPQFCDAGADAITFHIEATGDPQAVLAVIRAHGVAAGVAINPETPLESLDGCLSQCDLVLVMSVPAGFGGQKFQPVALEKLRALRNRCGDRVVLEVDGGVSTTTIADCAAAGAELFVVGSAIFKQQDYRGAVQELQSIAATNYQ